MRRSSPRLANTSLAATRNIGGSRNAVRRSVSRAIHSFAVAACLNGASVHNCGLSLLRSGRSTAPLPAFRAQSGPAAHATLDTVAIAIARLDLLTPRRVLLNTAREDSPAPTRSFTVHSRPIVRPELISVFSLQALHCGISELPIDPIAVLRVPRRACTTPSTVTSAATVYKPIVAPHVLETPPAWPCLLFSAACVERAKRTSRRNGLRRPTRTDTAMACRGASPRPH
jgi:hypothetical protein